MSDSTVITFEVPGPAVGKKLKAFIIGKYAKIINEPKKTKPYMDLVRTIAKLNAPLEPWLGAVAISIEYIIEPTKGWKAEKKALALSGKLYATVKPDGDNVSKSVCDALSQVIYKDDCQIVQYVITKRYGAVAKTVVTIEALEHIPTQQKLI